MIFEGGRDHDERPLRVAGYGWQTEDTVLIAMTAVYFLIIIGMPVAVKMGWIG